MGAWSGAVRVRLPGWQSCANPDDWGRQQEAGSQQPDCSLERGGQGARERVLFRLLVGVRGAHNDDHDYRVGGPGGPRDDRNLVWRLGPFGIPDEYGSNSYGLDS